MINQANFKPYCQISSPGKAILCGEHAVVYGKDAIAIGIGLHCKATLFKRPCPSHPANLIINSSIQTALIINEGVMQLLSAKHLEKQKYSYEQFEKDLQEYQHHCNILKSHFQKSIHYKISLLLKSEQISWQEWSQHSKYDFSVQVQSDIPIGKCLGSSAAFNTILSTACLIIFQKIQHDASLSHELKERINTISLKFEAVEHGTPSGIDNYISVHGGVIIYNKTKEPRFTTLTNSAINLKKLMNIGVIDTGIEKNTKVAVSNVRAKYESAQVYKQMIDEIGQISVQVAAIIQSTQCNDSSINQLLKLTSKNHQLLRQLGVSHPKIQQIAKQWEQKGWSVKITGSGMGGCVLMLSHKSITNTQGISLAALDEKGLQITPIDLQ